MSRPDKANRLIEKDHSRTNLIVKKQNYPREGKQTLHHLYQNQFLKRNIKENAF